MNQTSSNKLWIIIAFIVGLIIGALIIWACYCCCCSGSCSTEPDQKGQQGDEPGIPPYSAISVQTANQNFHTYYDAHRDTIYGLKGFTISMNQYLAMGQILASDTSAIHGFRFYLGANGSPENKVMIIVATGSGDKLSSIYQTDGAGTGPCPDICDDSSPEGSPITK